MGGAAGSRRRGRCPHCGQHPRTFLILCPAASARPGHAADVLHLGMLCILILSPHLNVVKCCAWGETVFTSEEQLDQDLHRPFLSRSLVGKLI